MAIGSISSLGIGSGLELQNILDQLREVDKDQRVTPLQNDVVDLEVQLEEFTVVYIPLDYFDWFHTATSILISGWC